MEIPVGSHIGCKSASSDKMEEFIWS